MMELDIFIKDLLFLHDCVIVPDFGGFVANYRPAYINYDLNSFSPPGKDISFNRSLTNNDGLLIGHISEKTDMSYVDARNWVSTRVKEWKRKLEKGKKIEVKDIGVFQLGKDKNLLFEPLNTVNFLVDAYGLPDFQMAPLEELRKAKAGTGKITIKKPAAEDIRNRKTLRRVLIAVPLAAALVLIPLTTNLVPVDFSSLNPFGHKTTNQEVVHPAIPAVKKTKMVQPVAEKTETETAPSTAKETPETTSKPSDKQTEKKNITSITTEEKATGENNPVAPATTETGTVADKAPAEPAKKPAFTDRTVDKSSMYYIVAGSFRKRANANVLKKQLEEEDYRVTILNGPKGFYRVAIGGFTDKSTALGILKEQKRKPDSNSYWLLRK
ncbi:MAG: SPOR domain-containing protein [Bacteroidales bacterium]|nr:SPOR domain-containing protein [Bacteroidales bacterium]